MLFSIISFLVNAIMSINHIDRKLRSENFRLKLHNNCVLGYGHPDPVS